MESMLSTLAFALLIGAQFFATILLISKRDEIYGEADGTKHSTSERIESRSPHPWPSTRPETATSREIVDPA
jgi:hypothetical protein